MSRKKLTPLQEYRAAVEKLNAAQLEYENRRLDAIEGSLNEIEKIKRIETDSGLTPNERLEIFKSLRAWPRIVLGIYEFENAAEKRKKKNPVWADGKPSYRAYEKIGKVTGLSDDRIKDLCKEGRRHIREGQPKGIKENISAAQFKRILHGRFAK